MNNETDVEIVKWIARAVPGEPTRQLIGLDAEGNEYHPVQCGTGAIDTSEFRPRGLLPIPGPEQGTMQVPARPFFDLTPRPFFDLTPRGQKAEWTGKLDVSIKK